MKRLTIILAVTGALAIGIAVANNNPVIIEGKITSDSTTQISHAMVYLYQNGVAIDSNSTDALGHYRFSTEKAGPFEVRVKKEGYRTVLVKDVETTTNSVELNLTMPPLTARIYTTNPMTDSAISYNAKDVVIYRDKLAIKELSKVEQEEADQVEITYQYNAAPQMDMKRINSGAISNTYTYSYNDDYDPNHNTESYSTIHENQFKLVAHEPVSTFSADVDRASYSNIRRFLNSSQLPQKDVVRIEEMVNYFSYDYEQPTGVHPFGVTTEVSKSPWNPQRKIVRIGIQGKDIAKEELPANNLVFLLDVSGSMSSPNKLGLVKSSLRLLVNEMRPEDRVAIVVYAGAAGLVLESTSGRNKDKILDALDKLQAGGSTAGGAGIKLAYKVAKDNFKKNGNNRIILATDGDFNIGESSDAAMERLIEQKREEGVFLTVLGFGMGNYKDSKMEILADKGNGNYAYIDDIKEANKTLVKEMGGTLFTIAKDVKLQVEFNPAKVKAYRLVGYENRLLNKEDFNDDTKDAGEVGAGHTVTAIYEIIPAGSKEKVAEIDELKYQKTIVTNDAYEGNEMMTVKVRYKKPDGDKSTLLSYTVNDSEQGFEYTSTDHKFACAVAMFGMKLRDSENLGNKTYDDILAIAKANKGADLDGYRTEFVQMVETAKLLSVGVAKK